MCAYTSNFIPGIFTLLHLVQSGHASLQDEYLGIMF